MEDVHYIFTQFKQEFPQVFARYEELGGEIHDKSGPLSEKTRWLIKIAFSAALFAMSDPSTGIIILLNSFVIKSPT